MKATCKLALFASVACLVLVAGTPARAADEEVPSFQKRGDNEKQFVTQVGTAIVKAARSKPQKIEMEKYEFTEPRKGRTDLKIKMIYFGLITKKKYTADITVQIDSSDKEKWEVLNIKYKDSNTTSLVGPSEKNIQKLIPRFNGKK